MDILMTGDTIGTQSQKSSLLFLRNRIADQLLSVTIAAICRFMLPFKPVPCQMVVEVSGVELNDLKVPAKMFTMAFMTGFPAGRRISVVAFPAFDQIINLHMALQTFGCGFRFPKHMAFGAVGYSFQVGMSIRQRPRGDLGKGRHICNQKAQNEFSGM